VIHELYNANIIYLNQETRPTHTETTSTTIAVKTVTEAVKKEKKQ